MNEIRVVFVGCNPSLENTSSEPFEGTKSGTILSKWIEQLGLEREQCAFVNLSEQATKTAAALKKSDVDIKKFQFHLFLKCAELYHGPLNATNIMIAKMQEHDKLDSMFAPLPKKELEHFLSLSNETPLPKIIALGSMASWGMDKTKLPYKTMPHPSGLNRKLNNKENVQKILDETKNWLYDLPERGNDV